MLNNRINSTLKKLLVLQMLYFTFIAVLFSFSPIKYFVQSFIPNSINIITLLTFFQICLCLIGLLVLKIKIISNLSLLFLSLIFCLFILEIGFRHFNDFNKKSLEFHNNENPFVSYDRDLFKGYRPNTSFTFINHPNDNGERITVNINEDGYRGPLMELEKINNEFRSILIGDSFLQSIQVDYENTMGSILKNLTPDSLTFLQHGYGSYSPLLEYNWILKKGLKYDPDRVILFLYPNDFFSGNYVGDSGYKPYVINDEEGNPDHFDFTELKKSKRPNYLEIINRDVLKFKTIKFISFQLRLKSARKQFESYTIDSLLTMDPNLYYETYSKYNSEDPLLSSNWDIISLMRDESIIDKATYERINYTLSVLKQMNQFLAEKNIEFKIVSIPYDLQISSLNNRMKSNLPFEDFIYPKSGLQSILAQFCRQNNIGFLDLYESFKDESQSNPNSQLFLSNNRHFSNEGHELAAKELLIKYYSD